MNFWRRGVGLECMFFMTRSLELQALPYALNRPPRAAASFNKALEATAASPTSIRVLFNFMLPFVSRRYRQAAVPQLDR
jgi:hypothetical protein